MKFPIARFTVLSCLLLSALVLPGCPGSNNPSSPQVPPTPTIEFEWYHANFGNNGTSIEAMAYFAVNGQPVSTAAVSFSGSFAGSPVSLAYCCPITYSGNPYAFYLLAMAPADYLPGTSYQFTANYAGKASTVTGTAPGGDPAFTTDLKGGVTEIGWDVAGNDSLVYVDTFPGYSPVYFQGGVTTATFPIPVSVYGGESAGTSFYLFDTAQNSYTASAISNGILVPGGYITFKRDSDVTIGF